MTIFYLYLKRHWHRPFVRETNDTSDFVCKPFDTDNDGIVPLVEIEEDKFFM